MKDCEAEMSIIFEDKDNSFKSNCVIYLMGPRTPDDSRFKNY